jgi:hypothetical protein
LEAEKFKYQRENSQQSKNEENILITYFVNANARNEIYELQKYSISFLENL